MFFGRSRVKLCGFQYGFNFRVCSKAPQNQIIEHEHRIISIDCHAWTYGGVYGTGVQCAAGQEWGMVHLNGEECGRAAEIDGYDSTHSRILLASESFH